MTDLGSGRNANFKPVSVLESLNTRIEQRQRINGRNILLTSTKPTSTKPSSTKPSSTKPSSTKPSSTRTSATRTSAGLSRSSASTDHYRTEQPVAPAPSNDKSIYKPRKVELYETSTLSATDDKNIRFEELSSSPCQEKFEMERSEKNLTGLSPKHDLRKSPDNVSETRTEGQSRTNNKSSLGCKEQTDVKASLMDSLAQLDPKALLLIQSMVDELNSTKDQGGEVRERSTEPATLTPQQLNQLKQQLTKLALKKSSQTSNKGTPPPYNANHNTKPPVINKSIEEEILMRLSSRLSIISEMTEPEEISERDITYNSEQTTGTNDTGDVILSDLDDTLDGTDDELQDEDDCISSLGSSTGLETPDVPPPTAPTQQPPPAVLSSPSPPLPPQAFRNSPPPTRAPPTPPTSHSPQPPSTPRSDVQSSRERFKAAKNKSGTTQRAFGMNFSANYKIDKGATEKEDVAPSENAISLYVDDPDDAATSDGESDVVRRTAVVEPPSKTETDGLHRTLQTASQRVPPVGAEEKTRKQLDLQRKAVLQNAVRSEGSRNSGTPTSELRDDISSGQSSPRGTPVSQVSSTSSSRSTVGKLRGRSEVSGKSDQENRRSDISGKSDNSDRDSSSSRTPRSSPFAYGKTGATRSTSPANSGYAQLSVRSGGEYSDTTSKSSQSKPTTPKEPVPPVRTKDLPRTKDMDHAEDIIRRSTQEIRRLGFGRNSYQPPSTHQPLPPSRSSHARASFDDNSRRVQNVAPRTPNLGRRTFNDQGTRGPEDQGDRSRCETIERQRYADPLGAERHEVVNRQERQRQSGRNGSRPQSIQSSVPSSPSVSQRSRHRSSQQEAETVFPPTPTSLRKMNGQRPPSRGNDPRPLSYGAPRQEEPRYPVYNRGNSMDHHFDLSPRDRYSRGPDQQNGRLYHSLDRRHLRRRSEEEHMRSNPALSPTYQYNRPDLGRPDSQHRPDPGTRPEHRPDPGTKPEQPPHVPPRAPIKPDKLYENVAKLQPSNFDSRSKGGMVSLHVDSCSDTSEPEDDLTRISEPGYRKDEVSPSSPIPRDVHNWLRETISHARLDSESNTTSVEDNVKSDGRCINDTSSSIGSDRKVETKPVNGKVRGYHFDIDAAVAKLKIKKDMKHGSEQLTDAQKNNSLCNYYNPNMDVTLPGKNGKLSASTRNLVQAVPQRYQPASHVEEETPPQQMMNNPMQFIDVAHEKNVLLDMYSDKLSVLESNLFDDSKDPANLQRLILKHLVKAQNESSDTLLPNMKSQKLSEVQPDYTTPPYYKQTKKRAKNPVSDPDNFRCIGKIIYSTTGKVKVIELYRPYDGYFGFQISPTIQDNKLRVFISGFGHGLTDKLFTGLLAVGDEVLNVNGHSVGSKSFTEVISILSMSQTLLLTIKSNDPKFQNSPVNPQPVQTVVTGRRQR
ncbi:hypothetical protein ACHWQZ_G002364 [Mnemiopsis leidyi]